MSAKALHLLIESDLPKDSALDHFAEFAKHLSSLREEVTRGSFLLSPASISKIESFLDQARPTRGDLDSTVVQKLPPIIEAVRPEAKRDLLVD